MQAPAPPPERKLMRCAVCGIEVLYEVYGAPLHAPLLEFKEAGYFSADAFSTRRRPLFLGAKCGTCGQDVCAASSCSLFQAGSRLCSRCSPARAAPAAAAVGAQRDAA